jgi:glucosyl-dolichyl phosphate glucuronosyltransferase
MHISIIVPTVNRASLLARSLNSIAQTVAANSDVEVLIVDNGSTDETASVCGEIAQSHPRICWRYFRDDMPGLLSGRHRGAKEARGEILAYLDDDVLLAPTWLQGLKEAFDDPKVVLVGGPSLAQYDVKPPPWLDALWWEFEGGRMCASLSLIELGMASKPNDPCLVWGLNFSIRKDVFYECGGFHPDCLPKALQRYQGDGETGLSLKIKAKGLSALYHPDVAVTHIIPVTRLTPESFEQRAFYTGVCNSYTRIRGEGFVEPAPEKSWKDAIRPLKRKIHRAALLRRGDAKAIRELMARAMSMGAAFHQNEVRSDATLLQWVLRPDYFDYSLPEGWEQYLSHRQ